jgi:catechol 1,2-dioxygenase
MTTTTAALSAKDTGASASAAFKAAYRAGAAVDPERVAGVVGAILGGISNALREQAVSYDEYNAAKAWLIEVGESGEWPLLLDVFVEHVIEDIAAQVQQGTKGTILGPFYLPGAPVLPSPATLPIRAQEKGERMVLAGQVRGLDGSPRAGAEVDMWQADADGYYAGFGGPDGNLRGVVVTDAEGRFEITTIKPAAYQIPTDGPTGALLSAAGRHPWRPAHLHLIVRAPGYRDIVSQLYFEGGDWLDSDVASATKPELMLSPVPGPDGVLRAEYDFVLEAA